MASDFKLIPKTEKDIESYKLPSGEQIKTLFRELRKDYPFVREPLILSKSRKKLVLISRELLHDIPNLDAYLRRKQKLMPWLKDLKVMFGSGKKAETTNLANKGNSFENEVVRDLQLYREEGINSDGIKHRSFLKSFIKDFKLDKEDFEVNFDASKNTSRPLAFIGNDVVINSKNFDIGSIISDITLTDKKTGKVLYYLSLKSGNKITLANAGIKTLIKDSDFKDGSIASPKGKKLLKLFGIDESKFISLFNSYSKHIPGAKEEIVDVTSSIKKKAIKEFLSSAIGHGYIYLHAISGSKIEYFNMDQETLSRITTPTKVFVVYPPAGLSKRLNIFIETAKTTFTIVLRNKDSGVFPAHLLCDTKGIKQ